MPDLPPDHQLGPGHPQPLLPDHTRQIDPRGQRDDRNALGDDFADPATADRRRLGESFADPNSLDDTKLGEAFVDSNSTGKHRREHEHARKAAAAAQKPKPDRRIFFTVLLIAFVVLLIVFFAGLLPRLRQNRNNDQRADEHAHAEPTVDAFRVERPQTGAPLVVPGTTTPLTEAYLYARANGYLSRRLVDIGDRVHRGQVLAIIDSPDLDQQVDQAREQVRQAQQQLAQQQAQLALAKVTNDRYRVLVAKGVFSRQDGDTQETNFGAQLANVAAAQRNVEAFQANLRRTLALQGYERVTAPFDGIVTARNVDVGSLISSSGTGSGSATPASSAQPGPTPSGNTNTAGATGSAPSAATPSNAGGQGGPLFTVSQVNRLRILVSVPEGYAGAVHRGQTALLHFQEFPNAQFSGLVTRTADSIDQNTRTMLTEVQVDNRDGHLLNGMYAVATFAPPSGPGPITVSGDSIATRNGQQVVGVIRDGKVHIQPVVLGRDFGPVVEIMSGLQVGDLIAADVTDDITEGAAVHADIQQPTGASKPNAPGPNQSPSTGGLANQPPGGSSQYGDQSITDRNMQGINSNAGKGQQKGQTPPSSKGQSKP